MLIGDGDTQCKRKRDLPCLFEAAVPGPQLRFNPTAILQMPS